MQALTDRTLLFIILALVVITMVFVVFTNNGEKKKFGLPKLALSGKNGKEKEKDTN